MKKSIFLSSLFIAALFSACNSDEMLNEGLNENGKEVKGAELLSKGLSFGVGSTNDTRIANGEWENGDCAGLAWFVKGSYGDAQAYAFPAKGNDLGNKLAVNHRFFFNKDEKMFQSNSNVYVGWHMAYYPYAWKAQPFQNLAMNLNDVPQTVENCIDDRLASMPAISAKDFLNPTKIDAEKGTLKSKFTMFGVALQLKPNLQPTTEFTDNELLKELKVKKITVKYASNAFADGVEIAPAKVPSFMYGSVIAGTWTEGADNGTNTYNAAETNKLFNDANLIGGSNAVIPTGSVNQVSRAINCEAIKLDKDHEINMFFNTTAGLAENQMTVEVEVEQGKFTLPYIAAGTPAFNALTTQEKNYQTQINAAFTKIVTHLAKSVFKSNGQNRGALTCDLPLSKKHFEPDFTSISNITEWKRAVDLVDALALTAPTFNITGNIECTDEIPMPKNVTVLNVTAAAGKAIVAKGKVSYPAKLNTNATVNLTVDGTLDVASVETVGTLTVNNGATLNIAAKPAQITATNAHNAGLINIAPRGKLDVTNLTNEINYGGATGTVEGVIDITYGAYVQASSIIKDGTIQYTVTNDTKAYQINNLIRALDPTARVNTLVVPSGVTLDLNKKDNDTEDDPYSGSVSGESLTNLSAVNIILDGGTLTNTNASLKVVANIVARSGESLVNKVQTTNVTVDKDATLTVKADVNKTGVLVSNLIDTVTNKGTLHFASDLVDDDNNGPNVNYSYIEVTTIITNFGNIDVNKVHVNTANIVNKEGATLTAKSANSAQVRSTAITNDGIITGDVKN